MKRSEMPPKLRCLMCLSWHVEGPCPDREPTPEVLTGQVPVDEVSGNRCCDDYCDTDTCCCGPENCEYA